MTPNAALNPVRSWWPLVLVPLIPGWAMSFAMFPNAAPSVAAIGTIAMGSGMLFSYLLWKGSTRPITLSATRLIQFGLWIAGATLCWLWLQYALNPFRMRPVLDAILMSRMAPWQLTAGLCLFGAVVVIARATQAATIAGPVNAEPVPEAPAALEQLTIRIGRRTIVVQQDRIERLEGCDDYVAVFTGGQRLLASYRLGELAARLNSRQFVRVHRSHIVNLRHVRSVERIDAKRYMVEMNNGDRVSASRRGSIVLRERLDQGRD